MNPSLITEPVGRVSSPQTSTFCAVLVVLLGGIVLFGWFAQVDTLVQIHPLFAPMQFNTALCFALIGGGLYALNRNRLKSGLYFSCAAASVGLLTLYQYFSGFSLGIDELFMRPSITVNTSHPGRMAPNTALCFLLSGVAVGVRCALPKNEVATIVLSTLGAMVASLAGIALIGYLFELSNTTGWGELTRMALHTAAGFAILSLGILSRRRSATATFQHIGIFALPIPVFVGCITATILLWQSLIHEENKDLGAQLASSAEQVAAAIEADFDANINALARMRDRWDFSQGISAQAWLRDANNQIRDSRLFDTLHVVEQQGGILLVSQKDAEKNKLLHNLIFGDEVINQLEVVEPVDGNHNYRLAWSRDGTVLHIVMPITADAPGAALVASVDVKRWLHEERQYASAGEEFVAIGRGAQLLIGSRPNDSDQYGHQSAKVNLSLANDQWWVVVGADMTSVHWQHISLSSAVLIFGLLVASLLSTLLFFWAKVRRDSVELTHANDVLANAYREREKAEQHFKLLLDSAAEGIFGLDADGLTTFVNPAACAMLGYSSNELIGHSMRAALLDNQLDSEPSIKFASGICEVIADGVEHASNEELLWRNDGSAFAVDYSSTPVYQEGNLMGAVVVFRDISSDAEQKEKLNAINEHLMLANSELEEFAYVASHDLRTPLQGIAHLVEWITEDVGDDAPQPVTKNLSRIKQRIDRLQNLIDDLLSYSRATKAEHQVEKVDVRNEINGIVEDLDGGRGFDFIMHDCDRQIRVVRTPFVTVLRNLIDNAMKHHDQSHGKIQIVARAAANGFISIAVSDDGPGIPPDQCQRVFKLFETLGSKSERSGTGMGLALTRRLVTRYGGEINVEMNKDDRGCCFYFTWPIDGATA